VRAQHPDIARPGDRGLRNLRNIVRVRQAAGGIDQRIGQNVGKVLGAEPNQVESLDPEILAQLCGTVAK